MKKRMSLLALMLALVVALAGCTSGQKDVATETMTEAPTEAATEEAAEAATEAPAEAATEVPTEAPTEAPTDAPTEAPTEAPTNAPTEAPTEAAAETATEAAAETAAEEAPVAAEETAEVVAEEIAEVPEEEQPVLLASVNGDEIWSNNEDMQELVNYYTSYYASYGYDTTAEEFQNDIKAAGLRWAIEGALYTQKAAELGVSEMTEEQEAKLREDAKAEWDEAVAYYTETVGGATADSTEEAVAAARLAALSYIETTYGYTEESYINEYVESSRESQMRQNVQHAVLGDFDVTEEELASYFNDLVEEDKETYENNIPMYEYYTQYMGSESYYVPEGYRGITHILLEVDSDLMNNYTTLQAELEEQQEAETADEQTADAEGAEVAAAAEETATEAPTEAVEETATEAPTAEEAASAESAEPTAEPKEPVTQAQVDAAKQAILDSVQATVDEIMAKFNAGTPFADLIAEYGTDPGMTTEPNKSEGYAVHAESILWDPAFTEGAMSLKQVGDVSEPVLGSYGIHILYYLRDIPAGAVELTEELKAQLKSELLSEKESSAVSAMVEEWTNSAEIIYTDEGQALMDAVEQAAAATVETTEATEEALADENN